MSRPIEVKRAERLKSLHDWGKKVIPASELPFPIAQHRLTNYAQQEWGVSYQTALGYAKSVLPRLREAAK